VGASRAVVVTRLQVQSPDETYWAVTTDTAGEAVVTADGPATVIAPHLQSPDGTIWRPSVDNAGDLTWANDGTTPIRLAMVDTDGIVWAWTIDNSGVVTITVTSGASEWVGQGLVT
jgi:hypothetical protein